VGYDDASCCLESWSFSESSGTVRGEASMLCVAVLRLSWLGIRHVEFTVVIIVWECDC
jgi:hypothetical protein